MIDIVLATYNGQTFLADQIQSIQQCIGYKKLISRFIIVDDGSTDNTLNIIKALALQDSKIELHLNTSDLHGPSHNFSFGLNKTTADYIMLSDQDDVWLPEKIERSLHKIQSLSEPSSSTPLLVFTDKIIVDDSLNVLCDSYFELKNIPKTWHLTFKQLCQQNVVSGCTVLFNRSLLEIALPIPEKAYMHDWWLALVASRCGQIAFIDKPLIKYRQHDGNTIGARKKEVIKMIFQFPTYFNAFKKSHQAVLNQAIVFQSFEHKHKIPCDPTISVLADFSQASRFKKIYYFYNQNVTRSHFLGRVALLMCIVTMRYKK